VEVIEVLPEYAAPVGAPKRKSFLTARGGGTALGALALSSKISKPLVEALTDLELFVSFSSIGLLLFPEYVALVETPKRKSFLTGRAATTLFVVVTVKVLSASEMTGAATRTSATGGLMESVISVSKVLRIFRRGSSLASVTALDLQVK